MHPGDGIKCMIPRDAVPLPSIPKMNLITDCLSAVFPLQLTQRCDSEM